MEEYELILVDQNNLSYQAIQYPFTDVEQIRQHFDLTETSYGPLSQRMEVKYTQKVESDQLPQELIFEGRPIPNRTYMTACKLVGKKIYLFPLKTFIRMKPRLSKSVPILVEKRTQADELIFQRNKFKALEQLKKQWAWQKSIQDGEKFVKLVLEQKELEIPLDKIPLNLKVVTRQTYQKLYFGSQLN